MKTCCSCKPHGGDEDQQAHISSSALFAVSSEIPDVTVGDSGDPLTKSIQLRVLFTSQKH